MDQKPLELIEPILVSKIVLLRRHKSPHTFEEKVFSHFAKLCQFTFLIQEFVDDQTSYGKLPLAICNGDHVITAQEFISFSQALTHPSPDRYLLQRSVVNNCLRILDFNRLEEIEQQSSHWLLFSPLKRLREYLNYRHELKRLAHNNISPDNKENQQAIRKAIAEFQQLLVVQDDFSLTVRYLCVDYLMEHKNDISKRMGESSAIMGMFSQGLPEMEAGRKVIMSDFKDPDLKVTEPPKINKEQTVEALMKTVVVLSVVWLPWILRKR